MTKVDSLLSVRGDNKEWGTPPAFIEWFENYWSVDFDFDVCASKDNAKVSAYWTESDDCLSKEWHFTCGWMNPPYGVDICSFMNKAVEQMPNYDRLFVLVPARTDTKWFHDIVVPNAKTIWLIKGRFNFTSARAVKNANAPFPSMLIELCETNPIMFPQGRDVFIKTLRVPIKARGF